MKLLPSANVTTSDRLTTVLAYGALLLLGYLVFRITQPFLVPLAWSAVLAIFFYPLHQKVARRLKPTPASLVSTLGVTVLLIAPALLILLYTAKQAIDATAHLQGLLLHPDANITFHVSDWLNKHMPASWQSADLSNSIRQGVERIAALIAGKFGSLVKNLFTFFLDLFLVVFGLFFMFRDGDSIVQAVRHLLPFDEAIQHDMLQESGDLIFASVAVGLLIAAIQGALGGIAFAIAGIGASLFWAVVIAFFSLVPVVGTALIWVPAAVWLGVSGHWGKGLLIVFICGAVAGTADNIVRPLLLRNRTRLNELLLFISVLGGLDVFGLLGLIAGPTIVAAAMGVLRVYMDRRDDVLPPQTSGDA